MIMSKQKRQIEKEDLLAPKVYEKSRKELRLKLLEFKKNRRIPLGPYATFYFESFETMLAQVQEMLHIEKGGDDQLKDELNAYNPLVPNGNELTATLRAFMEKKNMGLIFPAWLMHFVPPVVSSRISISWNVLLRGEYGEPNTLQNAHI